MNCLVKRCLKEAQENGFCKKHNGLTYEDVRNWALFEQSMGTLHLESCLIPDCTLPWQAHGLCKRHYSQWHRKQLKHNQAYWHRRQHQYEKNQANSLCLHPGCVERPTTTGFCHVHTEEVRLDAENRKLHYFQQRTCKVPTCREKQVMKHYCETHGRLFQRQRRPVEPKQLCGIPHCFEPHLAKGMCQVHYAQWQRNLEKKDEDDE